MTRDEALHLADNILLMINARPRTPTRDEIAETIVEWLTSDWLQRYEDAKTVVTIGIDEMKRIEPVGFSRESQKEAERQA